MSQWTLLEQTLWNSGFQHIAGVDEAGRGPLAGPVFAAACIIPSGVLFEGINDSKKLSAIRRQRLYQEITEHPQVTYAICQADAGLIDQINILQATFVAMQQAISSLSIRPDFILVDGSLLPKDLPSPARAIVQGDSLSQSIAAASILAKVSRDAWMKEADARFPGYGFAKHAGYGTAEHRKAIESLGPCEIHRRSFAPLKIRNLEFPR